MNGRLKTHHSHWKRKSLNSFKNRLLEIIAEASVEYTYLDRFGVTTKKFQKDVLIDGELKKYGMKYAESKKEFLPRQHQNDEVEFYVFAGENDRFIICDSDVDDYLEIDWRSFKT